jgi:hypothetical protein
VIANQMSDPAGRQPKPISVISGTGLILPAL